ncbi:MAG: histidinol-phosphatase [Planctomycetota bacterium]
MRGLTATAAVFLLALGVARARQDGADDAGAPRWWKGNTHTHTLWSDGDAAPELAADWYREHGYHFLVLSDHNVLSHGERWFPVAAGSRLTDERVAALKKRFGAKRVKLRTTDDGGLEMRLVTLAELRDRFEEPGRFLLVEGEEITISNGVHINGLNLGEVIPAEEKASVTATIQHTFDAVREQGERLGRPTLAHLNHPNFGWAVRPSDVLPVRGVLHFEVYNGHPAVRNGGDSEHASTEELWDLALTLRLGDLGREPLYGVSTDDTHHYHRSEPSAANAGRGWVMVRADELTPAALVEALRRGDFYSTTGVELTDVRFDDGVLSVWIDAEDGVSYRTEFLGTRGGAVGVGEVGEVLASTTSNPARYTLSGDDLYVRARVVSNRRSPSAAEEDGFETAWVQPVVNADGPR